MGAAVASRAMRGCGGAQRGCSFAAGVVAVTEGEGEPPAIVAGRMCDEASEGWKVRHPCHADPLPSMPEPRPAYRQTPEPGAPAPRPKHEQRAPELHLARRVQPDGRGLAPE